MNAAKTVENIEISPKRPPDTPNAVTLAALQEAEAIATGKIQVEWQQPPATKVEW
jgi:hypothetical protein